MGEDVRTDDAQHALAEPALGGGLPDGVFDQGPQSAERARCHGEGVAGHRAAFGAQHAAEVRREVQRFCRVVQICLAAQAGVELGSVAGQDGELQAEGSLDGLLGGVGAFERVEGVVQQVEDAAVRLVPPREGSHAPYHAGGSFEAGEVLADEVEAP